MNFFLGHKSEAGSQHTKKSSSEAGSQHTKKSSSEAGSQHTKKSSSEAGSHHTQKSSGESNNGEGKEASGESGGSCSQSKSESIQSGSASSKRESSHCGNTESGSVAQSKRESIQSGSTSSKRESSHCGNTESGSVAQSKRESMQSGSTSSKRESTQSGNIESGSNHSEKKSEVGSNHSEKKSESGSNHSEKKSENGSSHSEKKSAGGSNHSVKSKPESGSNHSEKKPENGSSHSVKSKSESGSSTHSSSTLRPSPVVVEVIKEIHFSTPLFPTRFACISLHMTDRIRLLRFPLKDVNQIETILEKAWHRGIQSKGPYGVAYEFQLNKRPWTAAGSWDDEAVASRRLVTLLLAGLYDMGWILKASADVSNKQLDKDSLLFRYQRLPPLRCHWISISFYRTDRMFIIDAPKDFYFEIVKLYGPIVQKWEMYAPNILEIKFRGTPWFAVATETVTARELMLTLLECLERYGFSLYASLDQDNGHEGRGTDTWHCCRRVDWIPGMGVYRAS